MRTKLAIFFIGIILVSSEMTLHYFNFTHLCIPLILGAAMIVYGSYSIDKEFSR